jgi:hypothetical protein
VLYSSSKYIGYFQLHIFMLTSFFKTSIFLEDALTIKFIHLKRKKHHIEIIFVIFIRNGFITRFSCCIKEHFQLKCIAIKKVKEIR